MTTITLEVSDQVASDLESIGSELPLLLNITRQLFRPADETGAHTTPVYNAYKQLFDFLALDPSPERVQAFVVSPAAQARVEELLDKHGEDELTKEEEAELRVYAQINELVNAKKAEAVFVSSVTKGRRASNSSFHAERGTSNSY